MMTAATGCPSPVSLLVIRVVRRVGMAAPNGLLASMLLLGATSGALPGGVHLGVRLALVVPLRFTTQDNPGSLRCAARLPEWRSRV